MLLFAFAALETVDVTYDADSRVATQKLSGGGTAFALTQTSYDALGRPDCGTTRMNPAIYAALAASACTLGTQGSHAPTASPKPSTTRRARSLRTSSRSALLTRLPSAR